MMDEPTWSEVRESRREEAKKASTSSARQTMDNDRMGFASLLLPKVKHFTSQLKKLGRGSGKTASRPGCELQMYDYMLFGFSLKQNKTVVKSLHAYI